MRCEARVALRERLHLPPCCNAPHTYREPLVGLSRAGHQTTGVRNAMKDRSADARCGQLVSAANEHSYTGGNNGEPR